MTNPTDLTRRGFDELVASNLTFAETPRGMMRKRPSTSVLPGIRIIRK